MMEGVDREEDRPKADRTGDDRGKKGLASLAPANWTSVASQSTAIAALLYAYGWVFLRIFYSAFGVEPEEVGISFAFLVVRVGVTVGVLAVAALLVTRAMNLLPAFGKQAETTTPLLQAVDSDPESKTPPQPTAGPLAVTDSPAARSWNFLSTLTGFLTTVAALVATFVHGKKGFSGSIPWGVVGKVVLAAAVLLIVVGGVILVIATVRKTASQTLSRIARALQRIFLGFAVAVLLFGALWVPIHYRTEIVDGKNVSHSYVLAALGLNIETVSVEPSPGSAEKLDLPNRCLVLLGSASGITILYDPEDGRHTYRVPSDSIIVTMPCSLKTAGSAG